MRRALLLLHEADEALRKLERAHSTDPGDAELHHRLITARQRAGHYTSPEADLHRAGIAMNNESIHYKKLSDEFTDAADRYWDVRTSHGENHPKTVKAHKVVAAAQNKQDRHYPGGLRLPAEEDFTRRAREVHEQGRPALHAFHRHPQIDDVHHKTRLAHEASRMHRPPGDLSHYSRPGHWDIHGADKGEAWFLDPEIADSYRDALSHHYNYKTRSRELRRVGEFTQVQYKRKS